MSGTLDTIVGSIFNLFPTKWKQNAMNHIWKHYRLGMIEHFARYHSVGLLENETIGSLEVCMDEAEKLIAQGYLINLDCLGEKVKDLDDIEHSKQTYFDMIDLAEKRGMFSATIEACHEGKRFPYAYGPTVSIKPTAFSLKDKFNNIDFTTFSTFLFELANKGHNLFGIDIDMEEPYSIDGTIREFKNIKRTHDNVDIVHQTNVDRTFGDLRDYVATFDDFGVRLCIGIYDINDYKIWSANDKLDHSNHRIENIGTMNKKERKRRLVEYAKNLAKEGVYVKIATHDTDVVKHMAKWFEENGISKDMYEFQALYSVKPKGLEELHKQLIADGTRVRIYLPYAPTLDNAVYYGIRRACKNHQLLGTFAVGAMKYYAKKIFTLGKAK